jgi:hypothetical protein
MHRRCEGWLPAGRRASWSSGLEPGSLVNYPCVPSSVRLLSSCKVERLWQEITLINAWQRTYGSVTSWKNFGMPSLANAADPPLQDAILAWEAAVVAADRETFRVANGGEADPARAAELLTADDASNWPPTLIEAVSGLTDAGRAVFRVQTVPVTLPAARNASLVSHRRSAFAASRKLVGLAKTGRTRMPRHSSSGPERRVTCAEASCAACAR